MKKPARPSQAANTWGILLGLAGVPVLALMSKVFPNLDVLWGALLVVFALIVIRSAFGYFRATSGANGKSGHGPSQTAAQSH